MNRTMLLHMIMGLVFTFGCAGAAAEQPQDGNGIMKALRGILPQRPAQPNAAKTDLVTPPSTDQGTATANDPIKKTVDTFSGEGASMHGYEGALTPDDLVCAHVVDPFSISTNIDKLVDNLGTNLANEAREKFNDIVGGKKVETDPNALLIKARLEAKRLNWMPMDNEISYGAALHKTRVEKDRQLIQRSTVPRVKRQYDRANTLRDQVLTGIKEPLPYTFQIYLLNNNDVNAEALPGGYLYLTTGALESDQAELVLGHEIAHLLKRHQTRELQARLIDSVSTVEDIQALMHEHNPPPTKIAQRVAALHGAFLNFSRQQELQADACAVRVVSRIVHGGVLDHKVERYKQGLSMTQAGTEQSRFSTHPDYPDRKQRIEDVYALVQQDGS